LNASALAVAQLLVLPAAVAEIFDDIVVTAQKREQAVTDVSLTVDAFTGDTIRTNNIETPQDVAFLIPNVDIKGSSQGEANPVITIRGIGMNNFNSNNNQSVGVYTNEVFLSSPGMMSLSMFDVERIEVLKGPQGTLYGRNSSGGAINIINAKPTQEMDGFVRGTVGEFDKAKVEAAFGSGITDTLAFRLSGLYDLQDESYHTLASTGEDFGKSENYALKGQLGYEGERLSGNFSLGYMKQDMQNRPFTNFGMFDGPFSFNPCAPVAAGGFDNSQCVDVAGYQNTNSDPFTHDFQEARLQELRADSDVINATLRFDYEFDWATLTSVTGYIEQDRVYGENTWSSTAELFAVVHDEKIDQISQEFRLAGESGIANWVGGVFFSRDNIKAANISNSSDLLDPGFGVNPLFWDFDQETTAVAVFGSIDWALAEQWTLVTGLRYTDEQVDFDGITRAEVVGGGGLIIDLQCPDYDDVNGVCNNSQTKFTDDNVTGRAALEFRPTDDLLTYLSVSTGFKSGGFNGDFILDPEGYQSFDSEEVTAYELGAKATVADGLVQLNGAVFFYDYKNFQTIVPAQTIGFRLGNVDKAEVWGIDFDAAARPTDNLTLRLGIGYLDTEIKDSRVASGSRLPNAPEVQVTAGGAWDIPLGSSAWAMRLAGDLKYVDDVFRTLNDDINTPEALLTNTPFSRTASYTVVNARVALLQPDGNWEVTLWSDNLFDEEYFIEAFDTFDPIGATAKLAGAPRTWGLSVNYNFQ
jgi:iron complex outermembrane receptor protein